MDEKTYASVLEILDFLHDEKKNWEEQDKPKNHIYPHIKRVADWVRNYQP